MLVHACVCMSLSAWVPAVISLLTLQHLEDALALCLHLQLEVGAVAQHGSLLPLPHIQQAKDPQGEVQHHAHPRLHGARTKLHPYWFNHIHLQEGEGEEARKERARERESAREGERMRERAKERRKKRKKRKN